MRIIINDRGDEEVGIFGGEISVDFENMQLDDEELKQEIGKELIKLFKSFDLIENLNFAYIEEEGKKAKFIKCLDYKFKSQSELKLIEAVKEEREKIYKWIEEWFDKKTKNNDLWRIDQDDLVTLLLDNFRKEFKVKG